MPDIKFMKDCWRTVTRPSFLKQAYAVGTVLQTAVLLGITTNYSAYLVPHLQEDNSGKFQINKNTVQWLASSGILLRSIGSVLDIFLLDLFGRKRMMQIAFFAIIIGWIGIFSSENIQTLIVTRIVNSIFLGMSAASVTYITEICRKEYRYLFLSLYPVFLTYGNVLADLVMYYFSWRCAAVIFALYTFYSFIAICYLPESPLWYALKGDKVKAEKSLRWFYEVTEDNAEEKHIKISLELIEATINIKQTTKQKLNELAQPAIIKRLFACIILKILLQFSGYISLSNNIVIFFDNMQTELDSKTLSIIFGVVCFLSVLPFNLITRSFKLTRLILATSFGMICFALLTILSQLTSDGTDSNLIIVFVFMYTFMQYTGTGEALWVILPDLFPPILWSTVFSVCGFIIMIAMPIVTYLLPILVYDKQYLVMYMSAALSSTGIFLIVLYFFP